jgi:hypothetical protein
MLLIYLIEFSLLNDVDKYRMIDSFIKEILEIEFLW